MSIKLQQFLVTALLLFWGRAHAAGFVRDTGDTDQTLSFSPEFEGEESVSEEFVNSMRESGAEYFEVDIILTDDQQHEIEEESQPFDPHAPQRAITRRSDGLWPNGKVPYYISSSLSNNARSAISAAINAYSSATCIQFYPRNSERDYVYFFQGDGCYSNVGRVGGSQRISIGRGCEHKGIVMHEMFHALGRWHEQSRPDRDQFISVNTDNMKDGVSGNFLKLSTNQVTTQGVPYDFGSIMHYSAYAFSRNGRPTIVPKDRSISLSALGQRDGLSTEDLEHINTLYCSDAPTSSWSNWGSWSACSRTCNGGTRSRLRTCVGGSNCQGSNIQEEPCNRQSCPQVVPRWSQWGSWSGCSATCGGGRQSRSRQCRNGNTCAGPAIIYRDCNTQTCPVPVGTWSRWSDWSECSASCDGGIQTRTRECLSEPCDGSSSGARVCNTEQCPTGTEGLKHEGCYRVVAGYGLYLLEHRFDYLKDNPFQRTQAVEKCARAASTLTYSVMAVAAGYCISGNDRLSDYTQFAGNGCQDGRGAYGSGSFYMDVYTITDPKAFLPQTPNDPNADIAQDDPSTDDEQLTTPSSSLMTRTSSVTAVCITMLAILFSNI